MNWIAEEVRRNPQPPALVLPPRYRHAILADLQGTLGTVVTDYLTQFYNVGIFGMGPCFLGPTATGKTTAAAVIATTIHLGAHLTVEWVNVPQYVPQLDRSYLEADQLAMIRRWGRVPFLVLDDFAVVEPNTPSHRVLNDLISTRFDALRPTCWTGNLALPLGHEWRALAERYGALFARRLQDTSKAFVALT